MRPLRTRLEQARKDTGMAWAVLERDYLLSWILAAIGHHETLREALVFKGGTALKKCYFGNYRFSEDLDFSSLPGAPLGQELEAAIDTVCKSAAKMLDEYAPVQIHWERYTEKDPHPGGQEAFAIRAQLPWQRQPQTRVLVEISVDEKVLCPPCHQAVIHDYGEPIEVELQVYTLEEIIAEKLRAILQHQEKLEERGWARSRARDYYDIWRILGTYQDSLDLTGFTSLLREKCQVRDMSFQVADDFFKDNMLSYVERTWDQWLGNLVPDLPTFETVISELQSQIADMLMNA
jgi:predicted nucleotidyltransferase component of viral defense system